MRFLYPFTTSNMQGDRQPMGDGVAVGSWSGVTNTTTTREARLIYGI